MNETDVSTHVDLSLTVVTGIEKFCNSVLELLGKTKWEISVLLCDDAEIRDLNKRYRRTDSATDVLSFPQEDNFLLHDRNFAGDVIISLETAERKADTQELGTEGIEETLKLLLTHGILHLDGFDHESEEEYNKMSEREEQILSELKGVRIF